MDMILILMMDKKFIIWFCKSNKKTQNPLVLFYIFDTRAVNPLFLCLRGSREMIY